ncbi:MAG: hypothetical protein HOP99_09205 [Dermatophilaceae bacterium]|nr:hypothetical protein [Dermatophilaceae bacterium]NUR79761.1 hypothetical protein [Dermatophilaceae bacterium]
MGDHRRVPARLRVPVAAAAGALVIALAGCGTARTATLGGAPAGAPTDQPSGTAYGWFAYAGTATGEPVGGDHGIPGPVDALERADLRLPDHADVRRVVTQTSAGYAESYLFVFRVPAAEADDFCSQGGLGGARPVSSIPEAVAEDLDHPAVTARSRWCAGPAPTDARWSRYAVIVPGAGGDPATTHLLLQRAP